MRVLALSLSVLAACGLNIYQTAINPAPHPMTKRPAATVEVFTSGAPSRAHTDVALLHTRSLDFPRPMEDLVEGLRSDAADLGCDAVVVVAPRDNGRALDGTCIVYTN